MKELYLLAVGVMAGLVLSDFLAGLERRVAYRAADIAEETLAMRVKHANDCLECGAPPGSDPAAARHHTWCSKCPAPAPAPAAA